MENTSNEENDGTEYPGHIYYIQLSYYISIIITNNLCLYELFTPAYLILKREMIMPHRCIIIIWYAALLLCVLLAASFVNESLDEVKNFINRRNFLNSCGKDVTLILSARFMHTKLTVWKLLQMRQMAVLSIMTTFITNS